MFPGCAARDGCDKQGHPSSRPRCRLRPLPLSLTAAGALLVNFVSALILVRVRHHGGSLGLAALLSARNDVLANAAIILAGLVTGYTLSVWPDLLVGLGIGVINAGAAGEVYRAAGKETDAKF